MGSLSVTNHAVQRFRERICHEYEALDDGEIRAIIRQAESGPFTAVLTLANPYRNSRRITKYYYEWIHKGRSFYVLTDNAGTVAKTIIGDLEMGKWTKFALARRLPEAGRKSAFGVTHKWKLVV